MINSSAIILGGSEI